MNDVDRDDGPNRNDAEREAPAGLIAYLRTLDDLDEAFPDVDADLPPLDEPDP